MDTGYESWGYCERHTARAVKTDGPFRPSPLPPPTLGDFATRRLGNLPDCFDAEDPGKTYRGRVPLAREELRAFNPESLDPDENPSGLRFGASAV